MSTTSCCSRPAALSDRAKMQVSNAGVAHLLKGESLQVHMICFTLWAAICDHDSDGALIGVTIAITLYAQHHVDHHCRRFAQPCTTDQAEHGQSNGTSLRLTSLTGWQQSGVMASRRAEHACWHCAPHSFLPPAGIGSQSILCATMFALIGLSSSSHGH